MPQAPPPAQRPRVQRSGPTAGAGSDPGEREERDDRADRLAPPRLYRRPAMPPTPPPPTGEPLTSPRRAAEGGPTGFTGHPDADDDIAGPPTFRLRPIRVADPPRRSRPVAALVCLILGAGLLAGAAAGTWLTGGDDGTTAAQARFEKARAVWHNVPVDGLFPRTVKGEAAGPGGADRKWTRVAVAPDSTCRHAFDPLLAKALAPVGCRRLIRATYADETSTSVTTVGIVFTTSDPAGMRKLHRRFAVESLGERADLIPRAYSARGTVAAEFGDAQRASWTVRVLADEPAVVFAVTGFADGRTVTDPQPAAEATAGEQTSAPAQAGLGHDAQGLADGVERGLRDELPGKRSEGDDAS